MRLVFSLSLSFPIKIYSVRATYLCLLLFIHLISKDWRRVKIIKYLMGDFLYSPASFNHFMSVIQLENFIVAYLYASKVSVSSVVNWRESWVRSLWYRVRPSFLAALFGSFSAILGCYVSVGHDWFIIRTPSYRTFNTTNSKSGCCTTSISHPNKLCKNYLNVIFHLLGVPSDRFEIRFPTKTFYREARKSPVQTFLISVTCQDISLVLCCETSAFHAMLVASTVVTVECAVTPSGWLIHTDVSEEPAFIIRVMDSSVHI